MYIDKIDNNNRKAEYPFAEKFISLGVSGYFKLLDAIFGNMFYMHWRVPHRFSRR